MYTRPDAPDYIDTKGIQLVRRDNCKLVKDISNDILERIMHDKDPDRAVGIARDHVLRVLRGEHPIDKFVVSKALRTGYKNDKQPHVFVARKIAARRGYPVNSGERVPYVFVAGGEPDALQADKAEDPDYAAAHDLPLDVLYYVEHQLASPVGCLLELLVEDPAAAVFGWPEVKDILDRLRAERAAGLKDVKRQRKNARNNQQEITRFFTAVSRVD
jgi:DNA polymerase delta subunit 1